MRVGQEQLYFIRNINSQQLHGGIASSTVPRLYQHDTAIRECKKLNLRAKDNAHFMKTFGFYEVIPAFIVAGEPIKGPHQV
jgi:hypothetical protein